MRVLKKILKCENEALITSFTVNHSLLFTPIEYLVKNFGIAQTNEKLKVTNFVV